MGEWKIASLIEFADVFPSNVDKVLAANEIPVYLCNYMDAYNNRFIRAGMSFSRGTVRQSELRRFRLRKGDVIVTKDSETPDDIGIPAVISDEIDNLVCGYHLAVIRADQSKYDGIFLMYALQAEKPVRYFSTMCNGITRYGLTLGALQRQKVFLPKEKVEQSKIAEVLSATDEAIDKTRALVEKHRNIKAGLMQDLLLNTNWAPGVFTDIADVNPRIAKGIQPLDEVDFIPMQDVNEYGVWDIKETRLAKNCMSGFTIFAENDVLFAKITPCMENGKGCIAEGLRCSIGFGSTEFHVLRAKANADPRFIYQWSIFPYLRHKAVAFMTGSAGQQRVSADFFAKLKIGIPQKPEQQRIAGILTTADEKIQTEQAYLAKLQDIKRGLMQDLLTNKVSVDALM